MRFSSFVAVFLTLISSCCCLRGTRLQSEGKLGDGGRIVGGDEIRIQEAPYQASLQYYGSHICGAAIISKTYVITAAHCKEFKYSQLIFVTRRFSGTFGFQVGAMTIRVGSAKDFEEGDVHDVAAVKIHPWFNRATYDFDVSLLQLNKSIKIDDYRKQEISLPYFGEPLPEKTAVLVSGWG